MTKGLYPASISIWFRIKCHVWPFRFTNGWILSNFRWNNAAYPIRCCLGLTVDSTTRLFIYCTSSNFQHIYQKVKSLVNSLWTRHWPAKNCWSASSNRWSWPRKRDRYHYQIPIVTILHNRQLALEHLSYQSWVVCQFIVVYGFGKCKLSTHFDMLWNTKISSIRWKYSLSCRYRLVKQFWYTVIKDKTLSCKKACPAVVVSGRVPLW